MIKNLIIPIFALTLIISSCLGSREFVVESDYSYSGNFKKYKTYTLVDQQKFDMDTLVPEQLIQDAIDYRMNLLGYKKVDKNPNLLIAYKMFFNDFSFNGWSQPDIETWLENHVDFDETLDPINYKLKEGTLMILFVDNRKNKAVWQGYNSGLIDPATLNNERFIKGTVRTIFDEYRVFAEGYLKKG